VAAGAATAGPLARFIRADDLTLAALLAMLAIALGFGAVHALEPGHGKSIVAAYFIGSSGSAWQAAVLGMIVAITHSLGVFAIAAVVLVGSRFLVPETLYPWLTLASGVMVFFLGTALLAGRLRATGAWHRVLHRLHHGQTHHHGDHHHAGPGAGSAAASSRPPWATLTILGLVDGLVPTPSTLVVLLGAVSVDRLELGMLLVVAFSTGMALVMAGISLGVIAATALGRRVGGRLGAGGSRWTGRAATAGPLAAAFVLLAVGISMSLRALDQVALL
jgi:ABC-type nickel/cobalt efflux system permease component RcnA